MFKLLHPANPTTLPDAPFVMLAGSRWILRDYDQPSDAPPYSCISYAWQDGRVDHAFDAGKRMSPRTVPALEATIAATHSVDTWSKSVQFSYRGDAAEEQAGRHAAMEASQALWIDALCVPFDEPDRSSSLRDMGRIFGSAHQVIVVLTDRCAKVLGCIGRGDTIDDATLLTLEVESWTRRAWTYQEAVNSRVLYFLAEDQEDLLVSGQDFLQRVENGIDAYKTRHALGSLAWLEANPGLNGLEVLLADYRIADYADRSGFQVMAAMVQRISERPEDYFYAMLGSISSAPPFADQESGVSPAEHFLRLCEAKGDFSFIYSRAARSTAPGRGWRPGGGDFSPVAGGLNIFGNGEAGTVEPGHIQLDKMHFPLRGPICAQGLKLASIFSGLTSAESAPDSVASGVLRKLRALGFTGCGEYLEFETGFFFPQNASSCSDDVSVAVSCGINWVRGGPGLVLRPNGSDPSAFVDVGAFVGVSPKTGQPVKIR
jgi:Heterokaryon incompatibility protein (HET)